MSFLEGAVKMESAMIRLRQETFSYGCVAVEMEADSAIANSQVSSLLCVV
jgi:hypothetical protein